MKEVVLGPDLGHGLDQAFVRDQVLVLVLFLDPAPVHDLELDQITTMRTTKRSSKRSMWKKKKLIGNVNQSRGMYNFLHNAFLILLFM